MTTRWVLAKYVEDLHRNEPENVGLFLLFDDRVLTRFVGQRPDGAIDGRSTKRVRSVPTYKAWIRHWMSTIEAGGTDALTALTQEHSRDDNYVLEAGGEIMRGAPSTILEAEDLLDDLFTRLVDDTLDAKTENVTRLADHVIDRVQTRLQDDIARESLVAISADDDNVDELKFDYRYNNGRPHLMQRVSLSFADQRSWDRVHAVAWQFNQLHNASEQDLRGADLIALIRPRDEDDALDKQITQLERHAYVIDVSRPDEAEDSLFEMLSHS